MKGLQNQNLQNLQNANNVIKRKKRNSDNSRKFTSIVMTKECHFPGDEGASSEEAPLTIASASATQASDSKPEVTHQTPLTPSYDDYDEDFDFRTQYPYPSKNGLIDRMEPKSSNDRRSYADSPIFRRDNSEEEINPKEDFGFEDSNDGNFYDFNEEIVKQKEKRPKTKKPQKRPPMSSSEDFDDEEFGPQPKPKKNSRSKKAPLYRNDRGEGGDRSNRGKKKPKKNK